MSAVSFGRWFAGRLSSRVRHDCCWLLASAFPHELKRRDWNSLFEYGFLKLFRGRIGIWFEDKFNVGWTVG
jgi:hypothetical protein